MTYNLFLDDERMPEQVTWQQYKVEEWIIVRNYFQFVNTINKNGCFVVLTSTSYDNIKTYQYIRIK